jgi:hypothetical protein
VAEVNNGGDMVEATVRMVDANVSYSGVRATRGKVIRAEPVDIPDNPRAMFPFEGMSSIIRGGSVNGFVGLTRGRKKLVYRRIARLSCGALMAGAAIGDYDPH